jgi:hypothetical protein
MDLGHDNVAAEPWLQADLANLYVKTKRKGREACWLQIIKLSGWSNNFNLTKCDFLACIPLAETNGVVEKFVITN